MQLLQLRVLSFRGFVDRDVWIGIFPQGEKILVGSFRFGDFTGHDVGAGQPKARQCC